jgi:single-strand DNA-binding protein
MSKIRDLNKIFLMGRLGNDPSLKTTKTGIPVATFSLATSRPLKKEDEPSDTQETPAEGEPNRPTPTEETVWHRIVVWGKQGQNCAQYLKKGQLAMVEGSVRSRKYKGEDGQDRYAFEVIADTVRFLSGGKRSETVAETASAAVVA